jgi:hypothetical protein
MTRKAIALLVTIEVTAIVLVFSLFMLIMWLVKLVESDYHARYRPNSSVLIGASSHAQPSWAPPHIRSNRHDEW